MARIHGASSEVTSGRRPVRLLTVGALGGLIALTAGCSLTASTSTTSKTTLKPVLSTSGSGTSVFPTVAFSPTTAPTTVPPAAGGAGAAGGAVVAPGGDGTYEVQANDTLSGIASRLGVPYADLLLANPEIDPKKFLVVGQKLNVPQGVAVAPQPPGSSAASNPSSATTVSQNGAQASGQTYTVVAGDYFLGIAKKLGVPLASLLSVNNMTSDSLITPGMKLKVPVGGKTPPKTAASTTTVKKP